MSSHFARHETQSEAALEVTAEIAEARQFEERMDYARKAGGFLALTVPPRLARQAEAELQRRYAPERLSFDALLIQALREQAERLKIAWTTVLQADGAAPGSRDWTNLTRLVQKAAADPQATACGRRTNPSSWSTPACWPATRPWGSSRSCATRLGRPGAPPALWLLVPMSANGLPAIDGAPVPVISSAQWARIPKAWIENAHRAGTGRA